MLSGHLGLLWRLGQALGQAVMPWAHGIPTRRGIEAKSGALRVLVMNYSSRPRQHLHEKGLP